MNRDFDTDDSNVKVTEKFSPLKSRKSVNAEDTSIALVSSWVGIMWAGGLYGAIWVSLWQTVFQFNRSDVLVGSAMEKFASIVVSATCSSVGGMTLAAVAAIFTSVVIVIVSWTFGSSLTPRAASVINGAMAGYLSTYPMTWAVALGPADVWMAMFSIVAILFGYVGAVWRISRVQKNLSFPIRDWKYQFRIRHLLVATTWAAVIVALVSSTGDIGLAVFIALGGAVIGIILMVDWIWLKLTY